MNPKNIEFSLRPATVDDIEFIFQLRVKTMKPFFIEIFGWDDADEHKKAAEELNHAKIVMFDKKKIGAIKVAPETNELHLHQMQVLPEFQRKGVGSELVRQTIMQSKKVQKPITLFVVNNTPAKRLYDHLGFKVTEEYEHNCRMCWIPK